MSNHINVDLKVCGITTSASITTAANNNIKSLGFASNNLLGPNTCDDKLIKNFNAILDTLEKEKSNNTVKGDLVKSTFVTSTMGVSYKIKLNKNI